MDIQSLLNELPVAIVLFDEAIAPRFCNNRAAKILGIRDRSQLSEHHLLFAPLEAAINGCKQKLDDGLSESSLVQDVQLTNSQGQQLSLVFISTRLTGRNMPQLARGYAVSLFQAGWMTTLISVLQQMRQSRPLILSEIFDMRTLHKALEHQSTDTPNGSASDLVSALNEVVKLLDKLLPPSLHIKLDVKSSALVQMPDKQLIYLLSTVMFEAADFAGPFGRLTVSSSLRLAPAAQANQPSLVASQLALVITSERASGAFLDPLEEFLAKRILPMNYKVGVRDGKDRHTLPEESYPSSLRLSAQLLKSGGGTLQIERKSNETLVTALALPLSRHKMR